jgi:hypothetical protein
MNTILEKLQRSWLLFRRSVQVIIENPKLLVFPVLTGAFTAAIGLFFLAPVVLVVLAPHWIEGSRIQAVADSSWLGCTFWTCSWRRWPMWLLIVRLWRL